MNLPGRAEGNWRWRCTEDMLSGRVFDWLRDLTQTTRRTGTLGRRDDKVMEAHQ